MTYLKREKYSLIKPRKVLLVCHFIYVVVTVYFLHTCIHFYSCFIRSMGFAVWFNPLNWRLIAPVQLFYKLPAFQAWFLFHVLSSLILTSYQIRNMFGFSDIVFYHYYHHQLSDTNEYWNQTHIYSQIFDV